jgi:hypothetical protein
MGRKHLLIWSDRNFLELAQWDKTCRMEEQRKRQEFKLFVVGLPPLLSAQRNPHIIQGVDMLKMASEHTLAMGKILDIRKFQRYFNPDELRQVVRLYNSLVPPKSVTPKKKTMSECACVSSN